MLPLIYTNTMETILRQYKDKKSVVIAPFYGSVVHKLTLRMRDDEMLYPYSSALSVLFVKFVKIDC